MSKKKTVLDVLMHMSKHYNNNDVWFNINRSRKLIHELKNKGFDLKLINQSFDWLISLMRTKITLEKLPSDRSALRIFSKEEKIYFNLSGINFILFLQAHEILDTLTRELVIQQTLLLQLESITIPIIKGVVALVLFVNELDTSDKLKKLNFLLLQEDTPGEYH